MKLFLLQPFPSHYYPVFGLARTFSDQGEQVVFTTTPSLEQTVRKEGFDCTNFQYMSEYVITNFKTFLGILLKNLASKESYLQRQNEFGSAFSQTLGLITEYRPSHVYIDQSLAEYYFFFRPYVPHITIVHTKFYSGKVKGIPPMTSLHMPKGNRFSQIKIEYLWLKVLLQQRKREFIQKMAFLGRDEVYFWKKHCKKYGMNWRKQVDFRHCLNRGVKNAQNMVFAPKELEFPAIDRVKNLQFHEEVYFKDERAYTTTAYNDLKKRCLRAKQGKVIYMAFGTLAQGRKVVDFFNIVISVVENLTNTLLIISKGNNTMKLKTSKKTVLLDYAPQQDILSHADMFITHGGLGSVKDAFYHKVPMLVVPMNKGIDQNGNAMRVKSKGLGDYIDIDHYSTTEILQKINALISPKIRSKANQVHEPKNQKKMVPDLRKGNAQTAPKASP